MLGLALALAISSITGIVRDSTGAVVPGAVVVVRPGGASSVSSQGERQVVTGPDGRFTIDVPDSGDVNLVVRAGGFAESTRRLTSADLASEISVTVEPASILETVTVTPARGE